ncbi:MAG: glutaredoxin domain-containing protein [Pseudomonadota bacterium]
MKRYVLSNIICALIGSAIMSCVAPVEGFSQNRLPKDSNSQDIIAVTFFTSSECPFCDNIKELLEDLKTRFPIRTDVFDINEPYGYDLFSKIGSVHKEKKVAVPLVIVGKEIMVGQSEIFGKIEKTIRLRQTSKEHIPSVRELAKENSRSAFSDKAERQKVGAEPNHSKNSKDQKATNSHKIKIISDNPN